MIPRILIYYSDSTEQVRLEKLAEERGFQRQSVSDLGSARQSAAQKKYDLLLAPVRLSFSQQGTLADALWQSSPGARLMLYNLSSEGRKIDHFQARLSGAEVALGEDALNLIARRMDELRPELAIAPENFRIMVVEDLDSPREIICSFVEAIGYPSVSGKRSAQEALVELNTSPESTACILTDIKMPVMNGKELIDKIRQSPKLNHLPIIVITALGTADTLVDCLSAGASGFLVKPPKRTDMTRELARALRIYCERLNPRLVERNDAERVRTLLMERGLVS